MSGELPSGPRSHRMEEGQPDGRPARAAGLAAGAAALPTADPAGAFRQQSARLACDAQPVCHATACALRPPCDVPTQGTRYT